MTRNCGSSNGGTLEQLNLMNNTVRATIKASEQAASSGHKAYASLAGVYPDGAESCWRVEQSQLDNNRVEASTQQGTSLASLGVIRDADRTGKDLYINQTNFTNNTVSATAGSGGMAASSLTLAEDDQLECGMPFSSARISANESDCSANCSLASVNLTQSGMEGNRLLVGPLAKRTGREGSTSADGSPCAICFRRLSAIPSVDFPARAPSNVQALKRMQAS